MFCNAKVKSCVAYKFTVDSSIGSQALLPTPPSIQMPVPMPAVPPQFMVCNFSLMYILFFPIFLKNA